MNVARRLVGRPTRLVVAILLVPGIASAQSGVSPSRLKLPAGPGSLEGVGENAEPNVNMGLMSWGMDLHLPEGYEGMTPSLRLGYSSGSGNSVVGLGWSFGLPSIERMTSRGLPDYHTGDRIAADGGTELVRVDDLAGIYRARFEGGFVRYTWKASDDGARGWWLAEYPDGSRGYFGADADGHLDENAIVEGPDGVYRWHLVEKVDLLGHRIRVYYMKDEGNSSHPTRVGWVFRNGEPRYAVDFEYSAPGERADELSDGKPGFDLRLTRLLRAVTVTSHGVRLRRYELVYEEPGGVSRLKTIRQLGTADDAVYPIQFSFDYSGCFDGACVIEGQPTVTTVQLGSAAGAILQGAADLVDMNADGLPDVLDSSGPRHVVQLARRDPSGGHWFEDGVESAYAGSAPLQNPRVQLLDTDGDGRVDLLDAVNGLVYRGGGDGDWAGEPDFLDAHLPDPGPLRTFFDFDNDKRIDVVHAASDATFFFRNIGGGAFAQTEIFGDEIGRALSAGLQLADMNGDGMQDPVFVTDGLVEYRLNLGRGRLSGDAETWIVMAGAPAGLQNGVVRLVDMNMDGLSDLVFVHGARVDLWLNRGGRGFTQGVGLGLQEVPNLPAWDAATMTLRFADMNGSGSVDVVWVHANGQVDYLDLFPTRPNLLRRITNGIGKVIEVDYGSSVDHMVRDAAGGGSWETWQIRLPNPMLTVDAIRTRDTLSGNVHEQRFAYHNGYFDGYEQQFRGFRDVEVFHTGSDTVDESLVVHRFDVGRPAPADLDPDLTRSRRGSLVEQTWYSGGVELQTAETVYAQCDLEGVPETEPPVRWVCPKQSAKVIKEGRPASEHVTVAETYTYDGFGNRTRTSKLGVVQRGGKDCNAECTGDEAYADVEYVHPSDAGGRWLLRRAWRQVTRGALVSGPKTETISRFDGLTQPGIIAGKGLVTSVTERLDDGSTIESQRFEYDQHGNVMRARNANGHARRFEYDADGLLLTAEVIELDDYELRRELVPHPVYDHSIEATDWIRVVDDAPVTPRRSTRYGYDAFGRLTAIARPGDDLVAPTETYQFDLGDPVSRIIKRTRSTEGGALDLEEIRCLDGMGRLIQERTRLAVGYQVTGFTVYNAHGGEERKYQPWLVSAPVDGKPPSACDKTPPTSVGFVEMRFDALGRPKEVLQPLAESEGTERSRMRFEYGPLYRDTWDEGDEDPDEPTWDTPTRVRTDGLGRTVAITRLSAPLAAGQSPESVGDVTRIGWDVLGRVAALTDPAGNTRLQTWDLLGRLVAVDDPDMGLTTMEYDAVGNRIRRQHGAVVTEYAFDAANRTIGMWDAADPLGTAVRWEYDQTGSCDAFECPNLPGRLGRVTWPGGYDETNYDIRGQSTLTRRNFGGHTFDFEVVRDNAGRVTASLLPGGRVLHYDLDAAGRLVGVGGWVDEVAYDAASRFASYTLSNGTVTRYGYDARSRLTSLRTDGPGGEVLQDFQYARNRLGHITSVVDGRPGEAAAPGGATYRYDAYSRLVEAALEPGSAGEELVSYTYDALDNILSKTSSLGELSGAHVGEYTYQADQPHAVTQAGPHTLAYDARGNLVERDGYRFEWDYLGRLTRVTDGADGPVLAEHVYGPDRERIARREGERITWYLSDDYEIRDGISTIFIRLGSQRVARLEVPDLAAQLYQDLAPAVRNGETLVPDGDGAIRASDAWLHRGVDQGFADVEGAQPEPVGELLVASARRMLVGDGGRKTFMLHDHLTSTDAVLDSEGRVVRRMRYFPYGSPRELTAREELEYGFAGKERDASTSLTYFGARYLDGQLGRWVSPDPAFFLVNAENVGAFVSARGYTFVQNNPVNLIDPDGFAETKRQAPIRIPNVTAMVQKMVTARFSEARSGIDNAFDQVNTRIDEVWHKNVGADKVWSLIPWKDDVLKGTDNFLKSTAESLDKKTGGKLKLTKKLEKFSVEALARKQFDKAYQKVSSKVLGKLHAKVEQLRGALQSKVTAAEEAVNQVLTRVAKLEKETVGKVRTAVKTAMLIVDLVEGDKDTRAAALDQILELEPVKAKVGQLEAKVDGLAQDALKSASGILRGGF